LTCSMNGIGGAAVVLRSSRSNNLTALLLNGGWDHHVRCSCINEEAMSSARRVRCLGIIREFSSAAPCT
jgi:hypothetical protein